MTPRTLSIYSNPAILALSQDPLGVSAHRVWRSTNSSLWTGPLSGGDYVVALLNTGTASLSMNASLADIFFDASSTGTSANGLAAEVMRGWEVWDLWARRMGDGTAAEMLSSGGNATGNGTAAGEAVRYNSTQMSYAEGLARNESALLGVRVGAVEAGGTLRAEVEGHGVKVFRLRPLPGSGRGKRDEL